MANSIELTATSDYQTAGKQHIGLVTGPSQKWGVALEFVGCRSGKRGDVTSVTVIDPGLYRVRDTTRKGTDDTFVLVWSLDGDLIRTELAESDALRLAKDLSDEEIAAAGRRVEIADTEEAIVSSEAKNQDDIVDVSWQAAQKLRCPAKLTRRELNAARRAFIDRLRGVVTPELPIELDGGPSDPAHRRRALVEERTKLVARLAEIDALLTAEGRS